MIRTKPFERVFLECIVMIILTIVPAQVLAKDDIDRNGFVFGAWTGYGSLDYHPVNFPENRYDALAIGFKGGYALTPSVVFGLEVNGWTLQAGNLNDPAKGEGVGIASLFLNYFPITRLPLFVAGGGGYAFYNNNDPEFLGGPGDGKISWFVGIGYEIPIFRQIVLIPQLRYCQERFTQGNYDVYEAALGFSWYSGK